MQAELMSKTKVPVGDEYDFLSRKERRAIDKKRRKPSHIRQYHVTDEQVASAYRQRAKDERVARIRAKTLQLMKERTWWRRLLAFFGL